MTELATDLQFFVAATLGQPLLYLAGVFVAAAFLTALVIALAWSTRNVKI